MIISLTGFMGCGKSSVGRELSRLLCCPFMDLDSVIEEKAGRSIPEIFATDGEAAFRQMESETLEDIAGADDAVVLALGGGTVMTRECAEIVHEKTLCIYLRASVETLVRNLSGEADGRPMLNTSSRGAKRRGDRQTRIEELLSKRSATYESTAHITIDTDGRSVTEIAEDIRQALRGREDL